MREKSGQETMTAPALIRTFFICRKNPLDNLDRLHAAADAGNVSAMRELARMMQHAGRPEEAGEDDPWTALGEQLAEEANLAGISDFGKPN
jgi:hypothetical protein